MRLGHEVLRQIGAAFDSIEQQLSTVEWLDYIGSKDSTLDEFFAELVQRLSDSPAVDSTIVYLDVGHGYKKWLETCPSLQGAQLHDKIRHMNVDEPTLFTSPDTEIDLPLSFHPVSFRDLACCMPCGAG